MLATRSVATAVLACAMLATAQAPKKTHQELDAEALALFKAGKHAEALKGWTYIVKDYPRADFRAMPANDPRKVAWNNTFFGSIVRGGYAEKVLGNEEKLEKAKTRAKELMTMSGVAPAAQEAFIKNALQPLIDSHMK